MRNASEIVPDAERAAVEAAIADAEQRTSAEIVPVIATQSGRYDRAEDLFGILLGLAAMSGAWAFGQDLNPLWGDDYRLTIGLIPLLIIFILAFIIGAWLATRFPMLARPFIGAEQMRDEMKRAGAEAFLNFRVRKTAGASGLLIYISLYERMVWVVGDDAVAAALPDSTLEPVRDRIVQGFKTGAVADALQAAVRLAGDALESNFPRRPDDTNELHNAVRFVD